eukprot:UN13376
MKIGHFIKDFQRKIYMKIGHFIKDFQRKFYEIRHFIKDFPNVLVSTKTPF